MKATTPKFIKKRMKIKELELSPGDYWDYFKQGLPATIILISAVLMILAQGNRTRIIFLL